MAKKRAALLACIGLLAAVGVLGMLFFFGERTVFSAKYVPGNPAIGFAPMTDFDAQETAQLVYVNLPWAEWEPEPGQYAYDAVQEKYSFEEYRAAGKHLVLRFVCDIPGSEKHLDIPQWLYEETQDGEYYSTDYGKGYCPDYSNEALIAAHAAAITALGEWLSTDNFCLYVELGSLGHWGEWHTKAEDGLPRMPDAEICRRYVQPYTEAFSTAKLLMRRPFSFVAEYGLGVYNDMVGAAEDTEEWLNWIANGGEYTLSAHPQQLAAVPDVWQWAPVGGEFTSSIPMETMLGENLQETLSMIHSSHMSFIGPKCPRSLRGYTEEAIAAVEQELGYRYRIEKLQKRGDTFTLSWVNDGAAPLFWDWPVSLCELDAQGQILSQTPVELSLSALYPGRKIKTATTVHPTPGAVSLALAITDPLTGAPAVRLAMECETVGNLSVLYRY